MSIPHDDDLHPTIFDPSTCIDKGLCTVAKARSTTTHRLYYEMHGNKHAPKKILFIMGLNNSSASWSSQVSHFSTLPDYCILVFDNRGVGNSDVGLRGLYKTSEMAKDAIELLDHVGWIQDRSVAVVGVSMGGMIAQELATFIPKRIHTLVLTSTKAGNRRDFPPRQGLYMFFRLFSGTLTSPEAVCSLVTDTLYPEEYLSSLDPTTDTSTTRRETIRQEMIKRFHLVRQQTFFGRLGQLSAALGHNVVEERLQQISITVPKVVVVTGNEDFIINPVRSQELHEMIPNSELMIINKCGHAIPSQISQEYNAYIERWVNEGIKKSSSFNV